MRSVTRSFEAWTWAAWLRAGVLSAVFAVCMSLAISAHAAEVRDPASGLALHVDEGAGVCVILPRHAGGPACRTPQVEQQVSDMLARFPDTFGFVRVTRPRDPSWVYLLSSAPASWSDRPVPGQIEALVAQATAELRAADPGVRIHGALPSSPFDVIEVKGLTGVRLIADASRARSSSTFVFLFASDVMVTVLIESSTSEQAAAQAFLDRAFATATATATAPRAASSRARGAQFFVGFVLGLWALAVLALFGRRWFRKSLAAAVDAARVTGTAWPGGAFRARMAAMASVRASLLSMGALPLVISSSLLDGARAGFAWANALLVPAGVGLGVYALVGARRYWAKGVVRIAAVGLAIPCLFLAAAVARAVLE